MRILIVEGDLKLGDFLKKCFEEHGYLADIARDGVEGRAFAIMRNYHACILDAQLVGMEYLELLNAIRYRRSFPVLILTTRDSVADRLLGLHYGADDYLVIPFSFSQLRKRLQALLKRPQQDADYLRVADLEVRLTSHSCMRGRARLNLTSTEFILLVELMRRPGQILSRSVLAERLWDMHEMNESNVIDVIVYRIRSKIDDPFTVKLLHTVRDRGYVLEER